MKPLLEALAVSALSVLLPAAALAQEYAPGAPAPQGPGAAEPSQPPSEWDEQYPAEPDREEPTAQAEAPAYPAEPGPPAEGPPAPPSVAPPPVAAQADVPPGEWVRTEQYGWVWMPYADDYTVVPSDGWGEPYMYVYGPAFGWNWLVAPWVWGFGPWPHFGFHGAVHFGWFSHGWWRTPDRWHWVRGPNQGGFRHGVGFAPLPAQRGAPFRGAVPGRPGSDFRGGGRTSAPFRGGGRMDAPSFRGGMRTGMPGPAYRGGSPGRGGFSGHGGFTFRDQGSRPGGGWSGGMVGRGGHEGWSRGLAGGGGGGARAGWSGSGRGGGGHSGWGGGGRGGGGARSFGRH